MHAQRTLERLQESWAVNQFIHSDACRNDAHCPSPNNPNEKFNESREYYLGSLQVCHAADALNSYCQSIMGEIIKNDSTAWTNFDATIEQKKKLSREVMIAELLAHKRGDGTIRKHLRDKIKCYWPFESDVIARLRNKFVHQNGHDPKREVEQLIALKRLPWCTICVDAKQGADVVRYVDSEWLDADVDLGQWACAHIRTHIHTMDQNLCFSFKLPRERWRPRPISRQLGSLPFPRVSVEAKTGSSPKKTKIENADLAPEIAKQQVKPSYDISQKEIDCARAHHQLKNEIFQFIDAYIKETGVVLKALHGGIAGNALPHTIQGHELAIEYDLTAAQETDFGKVDRICIRLRQRDFVPYVTVWSRKSLMRDFITPTLNDELRNHLRDVIDLVITR